MTPVFGANKSFDTKNTSTIPLTNFPVCGKLTDATVKVTTWQKLWDNGHFMVRSLTIGQFFDSMTGKLVAAGHETILLQGDVSSLPSQSVQTLEVSCSDGTKEGFSIAIVISEENGNLVVNVEIPT